MNLNISDLIYGAIKTDDSHTSLNSKNIKIIYENANTDEKNKIDDIFINLCGFSLNYVLSDLHKNSNKDKKKSSYIHNHL